MMECMILSARTRLNSIDLAASSATTVPAELRAVRAIGCKQQRVTGRRWTEEIGAHLTVCASRSASLCDRTALRVRDGCRPTSPLAPTDGVAG